MVEIWEWCKSIGRLKLKKAFDFIKRWLVKAIRIGDRIWVGLEENKRADGDETEQGSTDRIFED